MLNENNKISKKNTQISREEINGLYNEIKLKWEKNLKRLGVKLPRLKQGGNFTKSALILIYLYKKIKQPVSKKELTSFIRSFYDNTNDVQQGRHLANVSGFFIISGTRKDVCYRGHELKSGQYMLINLKETFPNFRKEKRENNLSEKNWEGLKKHYNFQCVTCGSKEGERNIHYPSSITHLQKGHMNPSKSLSLNNIIPQCEKCNRADRNFFIYNKKGRIIALASPKFVLRGSEKLQKQILGILTKKFNKK